MTNNRVARARRAPQSPSRSNGASRNAPRGAGQANRQSSGRRPAVRRRRWPYLTAVAAAATMVAVLAATLGSPGGPPPIAGPMGPEGIPIETGVVLAPASTAATGQTVDGVGCDAGDTVVYHVHTHVAVYVDGVLRPLPAGVGIVQPVAQLTRLGPFDEATTCYYWLHVHAQDGVIHTESPTVRTYTLGQFFDIWRQPLGPDQVAGIRGRLTVWVNGRRFLGNPRSIRLGSHEDVQIDVGTPTVGPRGVDWAGTGL